MSNQEPHQVIVFQDEEPELSLQSGEEIPAGFNHGLPPGMEPLEQSDANSEIVEIVDPFTELIQAPRQPQASNNYYSAPAHHQTQELPEPANNFVYAEENAFSFRNPQQQLAKKQSRPQIDMKISSEFHSETEKQGEDPAQRESTEGRSNNRRLSQNRSKSRFHDISDQSSVSHHKLTNKAGNFKESKIITPNIFSKKEQEQQQVQQESHKTQGPMAEPENKFDKLEGIRQSKVAHIKRNKLPPLSETKGRITILNSSATQIGFDSSMVVLDPRKSEQNRLPNMDSFTQMVNQNEQPKLNWIKMRVPAGKTSRCIFTRQKVCCSNFYNPQYSIFLKDMTFLITAKKEFGHINSHYNISINEKQFDTNSKGHIGVLKGNFVGTIFNLFEKKDGKDDLVCTITYKAELTCSPAYRVMEIYIRKRSIAYSDLFGAEEDGSLNLQQLYQMGENATLGHIVKLINKKPEWSDTHDCYVINLRGKSRLGSVKNMVLIDQNKPNVDALLFCKTQKHEFHLQIGHPLSPFITMGILLSSFDFKLFCQ